jgi:hypothetical protein
MGKVWVAVVARGGRLVLAPELVVLGNVLTTLPEPVLDAAASAATT